MTDKPKPYRANWRFGILNPYGDIWTVDTFDSEQAARVHLEGHWIRTKADIAKFKIVPVRVTVSVRQAARLSKGEG